MPTKGYVLQDSVTQATPTEVSYLSGVTSAIQTQLGTKLSSALTASPSVDLTASGVTATVTVDTNGVGIGAALVLASDGNFDEADADSATTMPCIAIALETGTGSKSVLLNGFIRNDAWAWTVGSPIYVSVTQGTFTQTAPNGTGDQVQRVGVAYTADIIYFNPDMTVIQIV